MQFDHPGTAFGVAQSKDPHAKKTGANFLRHITVKKQNRREL